MKLCILLLIFGVNFSITNCGRFELCEFDLLEQHPELRDEILKSLPSKCSSIAPNSAEYNSLLEESRKYQEFMDKLTNYEIEQDPNYKPNSDFVIPKISWPFRRELYQETGYCSWKSGNDTTQTENNDYLSCLMTERRDLINKLEEMIGQQ